MTENEAYITLEMQLVDEEKRRINENEVFDKHKTIKIATFSHVLYLAKNSFLKQPFDDEITFMNENGLSEKWNAPYKLSAIYDTYDASTPRKLNLSQLLGIIETCCGLLLIALLVFIFEVLSLYWPDIKALILCRL